MALLNCYTYPHGCEREIYERGPSSGYELAKDIKFLVQPPYDCIKNTELLWWLRNHCGFNLLKIPAETMLLWDAKKGGWNPDEIVIGLGGDEKVPVNDIESAIKNIIINRGEVWPDSTHFAGFYMDDVHQQYSVMEIGQIYTYKLWHYPRETFIIGDYTVFKLPTIDDPGWDHHYWRDYIHQADVVIYSGHDIDEMEEVYKTFGSGASYWFSLDDDRDDWEEKFDLMNKTKPSEIWLWRGEDYVENCQEFMDRVEQFCKVAREKGYLKWKEGELYLYDTLYCQRSDCRECQNIPITDTRYWGHAPLPGGICNFPQIPIDRWLSKRIKDTLTERTELKIEENKSFNPFISPSFIFER